MICAHCDQPIRDDEMYDTVTNPGASGAGADVYLHRRPCVAPPHQTAPAPIWR